MQCPVPSTQYPVVVRAFGATKSLNSATLRRAAAVVRHGRDVADALDLDAGGAEGAGGGLPSGTRATDAHFYRAQSVLARHVGRVHRGLLRGEGSALARSAEAEGTRALPRDGAALAISDGHDGVVEGGLNVHHPMRDVLLLL